MEYLKIILYMLYHMEKIKNPIDLFLVSYGISLISYNILNFPMGF